MVNLRSSANKTQRTETENLNSTEHHQDSVLPRSWVHRAARALSQDPQLLAWTIFASRHRVLRSAHNHLKHWMCVKVPLHAVSNFSTRILVLLLSEQAVR